MNSQCRLADAALHTDESNYHNTYFRTPLLIVLKEVVWRGLADLSEDYPMKVIQSIVLHPFRHVLTNVGSNVGYNGFSALL